MTVLKIAPKERTPNRNVIVLLEELMDMAQKGKIKEIMAAVILDDNKAAHFVTPSDNPGLLVGAMTVAQYSFLTHAMNWAENPNPPDDLA